MKHDDDEDTQNANHKLGKIFFSTHILPSSRPLVEEKKK